MTSDLIQAEYDSLQTIAQRFSRAADNAQQVSQTVQAGVNTLAEGGWVGEGADAFYAEMKGDIFPAMVRLTAAFQEANAVTHQIIQIIQTAEDEAASLFRGEGPAGPPLGDRPPVQGENRPLPQEKNRPPTQSENQSPVQGHISYGETATTGWPPPGPPFGDYSNLPNIPSLMLGPGATYQDLAAVLEQMYRIHDKRDDKDYGIDEPIRVVQVGPNEYLVAVAGTDFDNNIGANDLGANMYTGRNVPSRFQLQVQSIIEQLPPGATIHLAGHSQGGHVVMNLAGTQSLVDEYNIASVITFGSSGSAPYNPRIPQSNYHNFVFATDPINFVTAAGEVGPFLAPQLSPILVSIPGSLDSPAIEPTIIPELSGHNDYFQSPTLSTQPLPFSINQWEVVGSYQADQYSNTRLAWEDFTSGNVVTGGIDLIYEAAGSTIIAKTQNAINIFTEDLPPSWQVAIDRNFDQLGEDFATAPRFSTIITETVDDFGDFLGIP